MKDMTGALLALFFVFISLASLIVADPIPIGEGRLAPYSSENIHELELRYAMRR
jgi:hypothetical protein